MSTEQALVFYMLYLLQVEHHGCISQHAVASALTTLPITLLWVCVTVQNAGDAKVRPSRIGGRCLQATEKRKKEKTTLLSVIKEKLRLTMSFPLA